MKYLRWSALVTLGFAFSSAMVNCHDRDVSMVTGTTREAPSDTNQTAIDHCLPGQTFQCMGGCGAPGTGYQVCATDGRSLGRCICPPVGPLGDIPSYVDRGDGVRHIVSREALGGGLPIASNSGSNPSFGGGGSGGVGVAVSAVGAACRSDADCGTGLGCITASGGQLAGSGPAGGYCSASCTSDAACQAIDPGSECIGLAGQNVCARSCGSRAPKPGASKCLDRTDLMCVSVAAQRLEPPGDGPQPGLCVPACQSDAQCGAGLFCNLGSGLCSSTPPAGAPLGSTCTGPESCAGGVCVPLDGFESVCSAFCRFGGPGCGFDASDANPGAGCAFAQVPGEGVGDRGLCLERCQTSLDCHETGAVCIPTGPDSDTRTCVVPVPQPNAPGTGVPIGKECSEDADCAGGVCLSTESDPFELGGGFPGGYCSAPCTDSCAAGSVCVGTSDDNRHCMKECTPGPLSAGDCGDRQELTCQALRQGGFCRADCALGGDCGDRVCDPSRGLCVEAPPAGGPTEPPPEPVPECAQDEDCDDTTQVCQAGTCVATPPPAPECTQDDQCAASQICQAGTCVAAPPPAPECTGDGDCLGGVCDPALGQCVAGPPPPLACTLDAECPGGVCNPSTSACIAAPAISVGGACAANSDCVGNLCLSLAGTRFCSALCVWGTDQGCENYGIDAFCVLPLSSDPNESRGVCTELCNTAADCAQAGYECVDIGVTISGRTGTCLPPAPAAAPAAPPPAAPATPQSP